MDVSSHGFSAEKQNINPEYQERSDYSKIQNIFGRIIPYPPYGDRHKSPDERGQKSREKIFSAACCFVAVFHGLIFPGNDRNLDIYILGKGFYRNTLTCWLRFFKIFCIDFID